MRNSVWNKRIPSLLAFAFLIGVFLLTSYFTGNTTHLLSRASPSQEPQDVKITNVSDTSFTISYHTFDSVLGSISYKTGNTPSQIAVDDRDTIHKIEQPRLLHYFTINNLTPQTTYTFSILSGTGTYQNSNVPYAVTTGRTIVQITSPHIVSGTVVFPSQTSSEAVVYFNFVGSQTVSTLIQDNGTYSLDIGSLRNTAFTSLVDTSSRIGMLIVQGSTAQATAQFNIDQSTTLPTIVLGNTYDFTQGISELTTQTGSPSAGLPLQNVSPVPQGTVKIIIPAVGQAFSDQLPVFNGTAAPYASVTITIDNAAKTQLFTQSNRYGFWQYTVKKSLPPGQHTLTITARDSLGVLRTASVLFYQYASGANFLVPSVSPIQPSPSIASATATPVVTTINTPSPTVIPTITPMPTTNVLPTATTVPTMTIAPTLIIAQITSTPIATAQPTGTKLTPGSNSAATDAIIAFIPIVLGAVLIYLSKGVIR